MARIIATFEVSEEFNIGEIDAFELIEIVLNANGIEDLEVIEAEWVLFEEQN